MTIKSINLFIFDKSLDYNDIKQKVAIYNKQDNKISILMTTWEAINGIKNIKSTHYIIYDSDHLNAHYDIQRILQSVSKVSTRDLKVTRLVSEGCEEMLHVHSRKNDFISDIDSQNDANNNCNISTIATEKN